MDASRNNAAIGVEVADAWGRFKDRLLAFARRRVGSADEADDIVQDVLLRLLQHQDRIESERVGAWLFTAARNAVVDRLRASSRNPTGSSTSDSFDGTAMPAAEEEVEMTGCVQPLLAMLSAEDRAALECVEIQGQSQAEMATTLGVPASTVKSRVQRARQRLREHFDRCCAIELDGRGLPHEFKSRGGSEYGCCGDCSCQ